jgi:hypothetical protein
MTTCMAIIAQIKQGAYEEGGRQLSTWFNLPLNRGLHFLQL